MASRRHTSTRIWKRLVPGLILVFVALATRLPLFSPDLNFSPDAIDYVNIGRNVAEGRGFVHSIKWHFFTDDPVVRSAAGERPALFPLLVAAVWRLGGRAASIDAINVALGVAAIVLLFLLYENVLGWTLPAFVAALLAALNPSVAKASVFPWTESLFLFLHAAALLFLIEALQAGGRSGRNGQSGQSGRGKGGRLEKPDYLALGAGVAAALAYLARPNALVLLVAAVAILVLARRWRALALFVLPNVLILGIWFGIVWHEKGSPLFSVQAHHFRVVDVSEGMRSAWDVELPTRAEFARANPISSLIAYSGWRYMAELLGRNFVGLPVDEDLRPDLYGPGGAWFLLACGAAVALCVWTLRRLGGRGVLIALCAAGHFLLISAVWATHEGGRLLQPVYLFLLPLCVGALFDAARRAGKRWPCAPFRWTAWAAVWAACLLLAGIYGRDLPRTRASILRQSSLAPITVEERARIDALIPDGAVIAADDPFVVNWIVDRPTIYLPVTATHLTAGRFFGEYGVALIVVVSADDSLLGLQISNLIRAGLVRTLKGELIPGLLWFGVNAGAQAPLPPRTNDPAP